MHSYIGKENAGSGNPFNIYAKQKKKKHMLSLLAV
jgi:hypothetical protein